MKIDIIDYPWDYKNIIYLAGRNCYGLEVIKKDTTIKELNMFITKIIKNKHNSVLEHINVCIYIRDCTRSLMAQLTRHRLCSFSIKSQHYVKHEDFNYKSINFNNNLLNIEYDKLIKKLYLFYNTAINDFHITKELARSILPNACLTNIFMTTNIRELRYIIALRITNNNTIEMQSFAKILLRNLYLIMPNLFIDLVEKYLDNIEKELY